MIVLKEWTYWVAYYDSKFDICESCRISWWILSNLLVNTCPILIGDVSSMGFSMICLRVTPTRIYMNLWWCVSTDLSGMLGNVSSLGFFRILESFRCIGWNQQVPTSRDRACVCLEQSHQSIQLWFREVGETLEHIVSLIWMTPPTQNAGVAQAIETNKKRLFS